MIANHKADREELNRLINDYEKTMEEFNNQVIDILQNQSSAQQSTTQTVNLASINIVEPFEVFSDIQAIKTFWSGMVEADNTAKSNFSKVQIGVKELGQKMITFSGAIGKSGGKVDSLDIEKLRSAIFEDKGMLSAIEDKLTNGESLSSAERDLLYQHLQNNFFGKEDHEKMEQIAYLMEHDNEKLKDYINKEVLATEAHLEAEIMFLELYLFTGNERPTDLNGSERDRIKWSNYLQVLKNAHMDINETRKMHRWGDRSKQAPLFARVDFIETEFLDNPISVRTQSEITIMGNPGQLEEYSLSKDDIFESDRRLPSFMENKSISDVEYFFGENGITNLIQREVLDTKDEIRTYTRDFITAEIFSLAIDLVPGEKAINAFLTGGEYVQGNKENEQQLSILKLEQTAIEFKLELQVSSHRLGGNVQVQLIPSEDTFKIIDRWNAVHQVDGTFPYPETEINEQDWAGLNIFMYGKDEEGGHKAEMIYDTNGNIDREVYKFIMSGNTDTENSTVEEANKIINH
jgi:hypothetical protein